MYYTTYAMAASAIPNLASLHGRVTALQGHEPDTFIV